MQAGRIGGSLISQVRADQRKETGFSPPQFKQGAVASDVGARSGPRPLNSAEQHEPRHA
jgi:hypothetical protein